MYETKKIREIAERKSDEIAQIQHSIFDLAEYGYEVQKSASYLEALLEKEGFQVERGIGDIETAFVGTYGSGNPDVYKRQARACAEVWENPEAVNTAKEELLEATGGVYVFPIPDGIEPGDGM